MQHNRATGAISETDMVKTQSRSWRQRPYVQASRPSSVVAFKILAARGRLNVLTLELLPLRVTICWLAWVIDAGMTETDPETKGCYL